MASPCFTCLLLPFLLSTILRSPAPVVSYVNPDARLHRQVQKEPSRYRVHIVLVEPPPGTGSPRHHWESFLPATLTDSGEQRLVHSYTEVFTGFAARLTDSELDAVAKKPGFVRAFPDRTLRLATTHTPAFLGLTRGAAGLWNSSGYGKGVIVGLLDSGIHAAHPSFDDHGVPPPPARWKGGCAPGSAARCNNKLIGARSFVVGGGGDDEDVSDDTGHGTHTSSTAAGNFVDGASRDGLAAGTAAGIAPAAHVAMYKVCVLEGCDSSAILAGLDAAIKDGVDVLSISIGGSASVAFDQDPVAVGAFSAVAKGVVVVCAAGNNGPEPSSVVNDAPWILTVAAGSVDRALAADVELVDGPRVAGEALTQAKNSSSPDKQYPLLFSEERRHCQYGDDSSIVAGKILVCESTDLLTEKSNIADLLSAGAAGVVLTNSNTSGYTVVVRDYGPGVMQVSNAAGVNITRYATSTSRRRNSSAVAAAAITFNSTVLGVRPSPTVASFSGRGPSPVTPGVLKPDILAPGLNILAAWPPQVGEPESSSGRFNIISGTSMATPHISGVVALVRSAHPDWSPAAIKSAILTTSDAADTNGGPILDEQHDQAAAHATGAGHVNPTRAADPGLVYDLSVPEYAAYLCALLGDRAQATIVRNASLSCSKLPKTAEAQLNYPTITVPLQPTPFTVNRTVTNVGPAASTYTANVDVPGSFKVEVSPSTLVFSKAGEKKTFSVTVSGQATGGQDVVQGNLRWVSGKLVVRSPIVVLNRS